jgi:2,3-bisphosphoglycerate-independent phosphoglycerate mutase
LFIQVCKAIQDGKHPFVMCNFAPPDMVGHTGKYDAAVIACSATGKTICSAKKII